MFKKLSIVAMLVLLSLGIASNGIAGMNHSLKPMSESSSGFDPAKAIVLEIGNAPDLSNLLPRLTEQRVVYVGEIHDQYAHHLSQLEVLKAMYEADRHLAIGLEFFQQPFQQVLDDFVAGRIDEQQMLRDTEYYERWRYDYRLYRPILAYARDNNIPLIALNMPAEITRKVAREGMAKLTEQERASVPSEMDKSDAGYRKRLLSVFHQHPSTGERSFDAFLDVQLLWDEGMAERAAKFLKSNPQHRLLVLAGNGHLAHGSGIPNRVKRRLPQVGSSIVLNLTEESQVSPGMADYLVYPPFVALSRAGKLGIFMQGEGGKVSIGNFSKDSAAEAAGLELNDQIVAIDSQTVTTPTDVKLAMWNKMPGDRVSVRIKREVFLFTDEERDLEVELR